MTEQVQGESGGLTTIVGRQREIAGVRSLIADRTGPASAIVLEGEAGMGKTSLWRLACAWAASAGMCVLTAQPADTEVDLPLVALTDLLSDGLSMVYSFFDPDYETRSLGSLMILDHIERAKQMGLPYVYLGYWVRGSRKMDYKSRFLPQERLMSQGWVRAEM